MIIDGIKILDEDELKKFISLLPELGEDEGYLIFLMYRSRYVKQKIGIKVPESGTMLERKFITGEDWRDKFFRTVKRLAVLSYYAPEYYVITKRKKRSEGTEEFIKYTVPRFTTGILVEMNPARVKRAFEFFMQDVIHTITFENNWHRIAKIDKVWYSKLHKSTRKRFRTIDIDVKDERILEEVRDILTSYAKDEELPYILLETKRGWHFVIDLAKVRKEFYVEFLGGKGEKSFKKLREKYFFKDWDGNMKPAIDFTERALEPIAGTLYADFMVKILEHWSA